MKSKIPVPVVSDQGLIVLIKRSRFTAVHYL